MLDELERLRGRLLALEEAAPIDGAVRPAMRVDSTRTIRWRNPSLVALTALLLVVVAAVAVSSGRGAGLPAGAVPALATPSSTGSGGLTRDEAVSRVRQEFTVASGGAAVVLGDLRAAVSGRFADVATGNLAGSVAAARLVWSITFDVTGEICPPVPGPCQTNVPGVLTVYIDYYTGEQLVSGGQYSR